MEIGALIVCKCRPAGIGWLPFMKQVHLSVFCCDLQIHVQWSKLQSWIMHTNGSRANRSWTQPLSHPISASPLLCGLQWPGSGLSWVAQAGETSKGGKYSDFSIRQLLPGSLLWSFTGLFWTSSLVLTFDLLFALGQVALFNLGRFGSLSNWFWVLQVIF